MEPVNAKYILTGGSGILGTELQKCALIHGIEYISPDSDDLDITDEIHIYEYLQNHSEFHGKIHGVVHCAAYTDVPGAETNRFEAIRANIKGTENVINELCYPLGVNMVYISTDYVYPGDVGNYNESSLTRPVNFYAMTKLLGEAYTTSSDLVIRTSFKPNVPWPYPRAFDDLYTSSDYVDVIADKISFLISQCETGVWNVGTERKTIYDLARRRNTKVKPMSRKEITNVYLPKDISMNIDKYNQFYDEVNM